MRIVLIPILLLLAVACTREVEVIKEVEVIVVASPTVTATPPPTPTVTATVIPTPDVVELDRRGTPIADSLRKQFGLPPDHSGTYSEEDCAKMLEYERAGEWQRFEGLLNDLVATIRAEYPMPVSTVQGRGDSDRILQQARDQRRLSEVKEAANAYATDTERTCIGTPTPTATPTITATPWPTLTPLPTLSPTPTRTPVSPTPTIRQRLGLDD